MSVILDTSIWIEYLRNNPDYNSTCQKLLEQGKVKTIELIFAELLQGARSTKEITILNEYYSLVGKVEIKDLLIRAGEYSFKEKLISRGIGIIDAAIIVAAIQSKYMLWTLDTKIKKFLPSEYLFVMSA